MLTRNCEAENGCRLVVDALFCRSMTCASLTLLVQCEPEERCLKDDGRNQVAEVSSKVNITKIQEGCSLVLLPGTVVSLESL